MKLPINKSTKYILGILTNISIFFAKNKLELKWFPKCFNIKPKELILSKPNNFFKGQTKKQITPDPKNYNHTLEKFSLRWLY